MASTLPDYYAFLGIPQTATQEEVRVAYRRESLKYVVPAPGLPPWSASLTQRPGRTLTAS